MEELAPTAAALFDLMNYRGQAGGNIWGAAALYYTGIGDISESEIMSAARGAGMNGKNKPAHFYQCLANALKGRGADLKALMRTVTIEPRWPKEHPYAKQEES